MDLSKNIFVTKIVWEENNDHLVLFYIVFIGVIGPLSRSVSLLYVLSTLVCSTSSAIYMFHIHRGNLSSTLEIEFRQIDGFDVLIR